MGINNLIGRLRKPTPQIMATLDCGGDLVATVRARINLSSHPGDETFYLTGKEAAIAREELNKSAYSQ